MVEINWTDEAKIWVKEIFEYIAEDTKKKAKQVINEIYQKATILKDHPEIGQKLTFWPDKNIRMLLFGHYRIVYWFKEKNRIDILGVYHGALDLQRHLKIQE